MVKPHLSVNTSAVELSCSQLSHTLISSPLLGAFSPSVLLTTENSFASLTDNFVYLTKGVMQWQKETEATLFRP